MAAGSLKNQDVLDNFDFDSFLQSNDDSNDFNLFNSPASSNLGSQQSDPLSDFRMQLMLLEQQNKKRLLMERQEQDFFFSNTTNNSKGKLDATFMPRPI